MSERLVRLRGELSASDADAMLVTQIENVRYLSGFTGSCAFLVTTREAVHLLTDARYLEQATLECPGCLIEEFRGDWTAKASDLIRDLDAGRVGFEPAYLTYSQWDSLSETLGDRKLIPLDDIVTRLRMTKDEREIAALRKAAQIADAAFEHIVGSLRPGMTEKEIALETDCLLRRGGAEMEAFETLVASGPRSALPHGKPTERAVSTGELLLLDFGARWQGYHSDITRTVVLGPALPRQAEIHAVVLEAQGRAIEAIRPGLPGGRIDGVARDYIADMGYGQHFGHGLGHGLGLAVHDGVDSGRILGRDSSIILEAGMVVTVEPGIHIPGWGGIRIEDDVLVTKSGAEVLTHSPRGLRIGAR